MPTNLGFDRREFGKLLFGPLAAAGTLQAQDPPTPSNTTIRADVKVVNVLATVRDRKGQIIKSLVQDDFSVEEDGVAQTIKYFARESDLELTLGLLIDTSGSQRRVIGEERSASYRFLDQVMREDKDFAFVIKFDREVELLQDLTSSRKRLEQVIYNITAVVPGGRGGGGPRQGGGGGGRGGTALYDAVMLGAEDMMAKQHGRKALIVLSDGEDRGSKVSLFKAIDSAQKSDTLVYGILFADEQNYQMPYYSPRMGRRGGGMPPPMPRRQTGPDGDGKKVLERMAKETGGSFFEVTKKQPLSAIFERMQEELRNQYNIGYTPEKLARPGEFRKIHLTVKDKNLIVQARDGYYGV